VRPVPGLLAVIAMQRVFADPGSPWATPRYAGAAAGVARLLPAFGDRVVFRGRAVRRRAGLPSDRVNRP
jgi:hypothetical protein